MSFIGLLMVNEENDILADTLKVNVPLVDAFYVLDGTRDATVSAAVCDEHGCAGYWTDAQVPKPPYPDKPCDGYRQWLLERACRDHGYDNWFLLLHADEVWTFDSRELADENPDVDGFGFRLPFFVPHDNDGWDPGRPPIEQLHWRIGPGWPEFRMFRGGPDVQFARDQHSNVTPSGLARIEWTPLEILHYPYRSPASQAARAAAGFDPENYRYARDGRFLWTDEMIEAAQHVDHFAEVASC